MDVFDLRDSLVRDYSRFVGSFVAIRNDKIRARVDAELGAGLLWPDPLIQLNPSFEPGESIDELAAAGLLHPECRKVFRVKRAPADPGTPLRLHRHQADAVKIARTGADYVLTTGTGSGKSLAYVIPMVDHVLRRGGGRGIQAVIVYPMNALANSQRGELEKFLCHGYPDRKGPVTFARYTGQESDRERQAIMAQPPDILLTNYVMLELLLTRVVERQLIEAARGLRFLVLDELHTYRGRQGADVAMLVRRARDAFEATDLQCVGTSATLASEGTFEAQRAEVARVASLLFGTPVKPEHVIGETLRRATPARDPGDPAFVAGLRDRIQNPPPETDRSYADFVTDVLSSWIESTFGLAAEQGTGRLVRSQPLPLKGAEGAAALLNSQTGVPHDACAAAIARHLLAGYRQAIDPATGFPLFAFRLHQFISRGDTVYASPEPLDSRHITLHGQQFVPGDRRRVLLPLVFCRECGQEYYCVRAVVHPRGKGRVFVPRELNDRVSDDECKAGFLYLNPTDPWPEDTDRVFDLLPEDWFEEHRGRPRIRRARKDDLPRAVRLAPDGRESDNGVDCHFVRAPFRFCLACGVAYGSQLRVDFGKLASLGTEGRSTSTTVLTLSAIRYLRADQDLPRHARKILSFTDNRQDASLQAGHFNDFIEIGLLRSAVYRAAAAAGTDGLTYETLVPRVFNALDLPVDLYAHDPTVRFQALEETQRAFRAVLEYRVYRDLERGWRITLPNLEQCGLLEIRYKSLDDVCRAEDVWQDMHPALVSAAPDTRAAVARTLLDHMRSHLAIRVEALDQDQHERLRNLSFQRLRAPWAIDEREELERAVVLFPRASTPQDWSRNLYLSGRSRFGHYLREKSRFPGLASPLRMDDAGLVTRQILQALKVAGIVVEVAAPRAAGDVPGYQVAASALLWLAGDGTRPFHDPLRVPRLPRTGGRTNPFFVQFYKTTAAEGAGIEAREHTAQVRSEDRLDREKRFGEARLPIMFCSPTMELGVDIKDLNVVNLRNIPPTPANYAQRSGRAGRSGQPALVFSYCSSVMPHDQYFFKQPRLMVAGAVSPPRIDLTNQELLRAHIQAIWLAAAGLSLHTSLKDVLDLAGDAPTLALLPGVRAALDDENARARARERAAVILAAIRPELEASRWYTEAWLNEVMRHLPNNFDEACNRWRSLYRTARGQMDAQYRVMTDASRSPYDKQRANALFREARTQLDLLTETQNVTEADFYSYRYFASEGFLPGYSFPRLPLSAYIPGRRQKSGRDEFVSRPRFLALSEFGPRAIVYHEGARYRINKVMLPLRGDSDDMVTHAAKRCEGCGYLHWVAGGTGPDLCERCAAPLGAPLVDLLRLQNVSTRREDRISSDEEERLRMGYEIQSAVRFTDQAAGGSAWEGTAEVGGAAYAALTYGQAATIARFNLGWKRRADPGRRGFVLDIERGYWSRNDLDEQDVGDDDTPQGPRVKRVIPFVEDRRNCLLLAFSAQHDMTTMASLQAAIENAIQVEYQLEDAELAAEPLPSADDRRSILFYESAEGGAGVLRRLIDEPDALARVARRALDLCHYDPDTGEDQRRAAHAREDCEAACYDCLLSYTNQVEHKLLDRTKARPILQDLATAQVRSAPGSDTPEQHYQKLQRQCGSDLERRWLDRLWERKLRLPSDAQRLFPEARTRPDFFYADCVTAIYIDGPHHQFPERKERDATQTAAMNDAGYTVIRFDREDDWERILRAHPNIFGSVA